MMVICPAELCLLSKVAATFGTLLESCSLYTQQVDRLDTASKSICLFANLTFSMHRSCFSSETSIIQSRSSLLLCLQIEQDLESAANSEHYFLFEETLRAVLLAASREPNLGPMCLHTPFPRLLGTDRNGELRGAYPPSGLLPCR